LNVCQLSTAIESAINPNARTHVAPSAQIPTGRDAGGRSHLVRETASSTRTQDRLPSRAAARVQAQPTYSQWTRRAELRRRLSASEPPVNFRFGGAGHGTGSRGHAPAWATRRQCACRAPDQDQTRRCLALRVVDNRLVTEVRDIAPGLWVWSTPHPDWTPDSDFDGPVTCTCAIEQRALPALRDLLELPFERVIVSHGDPVHDPAAFERALTHAPWRG